MCGISLIINKKNNPVEDSQLRNMNNMVIHRGPDDEGYYHGKNFAFGHRRLSIIDLSQAGHQPMVRDNYCINYNGEIYNYLELIQELTGLGHIFKSHTDTEILLPAYWEWGVKAFDKFNGMWAFMLYDASKQEIILCRDRFGVKPLYYTTVGDLFLAASEIKQFTAIAQFKPILNKEVTVNFLTNGWLNYSEETFFEGVCELRPGHYMIYDLKTHKIKINQWYNLRTAISDSKATEKEATQMVNNLLTDSINLRMRADVNVGSCLSGGIDSSSIVSIIHDKKFANKNFITITSCYKDKQYDEQEFSDAVSKQTGFTSVKVFPQLDQLLDHGQLDKMIYHHDQPFSGASHYSEFSVFDAARKNGVVVLLDGQGSDEYFCGYSEFFSTYTHALFSRGKFAKALQNLREKNNNGNMSIGQLVSAFLKEKYYHPLIKFIKRIISKKDFPWLNPAWEKMARKKVLTFPSNNIKELSIQEILHSSLPYQLHSADRSSMSFSLEVREPFMDYRLIEYVIGLPDAYKIKNGYSKYVLREAVTVLPEPVKSRSHKMGFVAPDKVWMLANKEKIRVQLEEAVQQTKIFSEDLLERFDLFTEGKRAYEPIYFRAISLNRFCKIFKMQLS
ncbi:MAG: asparagine synthase (glutamine-hydrolyzing) [Bacteroidetes bacterium]|nr:asparagine synthase (glutamine-hydrolyzing) [Bacteroidota bacterium]